MALRELVWFSSICLTFLGFIPAIQGEEAHFPLLMPRVLPENEESYLCTPLRINEDQSYFITGFNPNVSTHVAHHMLIYGCEEPGSMDPIWNCGEMAAKQPGVVSEQPCKSKPNIIYAWAHEAPKLDLPKDVGFRIGKDSSIKYLVLQVHYGKLDNLPSSGDDSGVFLQFTEKPQPKVAGVLLLGTGGLAPPHSTTFFETACEIDDPRVIHPFAYRVHTHALGKVVSGWRVQGKSKWDLIGKKNPQQPQMFYPVEHEENVLTTGDVIAARCTMVNSRDETVYIGSTNNDEMCNFYLMYWVDGGEPISPNTCFTPGPPNWSWGGWAMGAGLENIPDEAASTL
ncbi:peptidylglycine alpha-hydroxylating monooxygenase-like [Tigriopus californicus]|nr:peptidylglycine alpha-hydroxylating monooxygenase-like [Tigriopus californicus]